MSIVDRLSTNLSAYFNLMTFGRFKTPVFAGMALETTGIAVAVFVSEPPFLPLSAEDTPVLTLTLFLTLILLGFLYVLLSGLGYRTYSTKLHGPGQIFKIFIGYVVFSTALTYAGYLLLVYPYTVTAVPSLIDIGIGGVVATVYAISLASLFYVNDFFGEDSDSKASAISGFLSATENLREKPLSEAGSEPARIIESGRTIQEGLETSTLSDSEQLLSELTEWLDSFEQRNQQGQKKMVGDIPDSETQFSVWEDRFRELQSIESSLYTLKKHAIYKIVLSIRRKERCQYDRTV